MSVVRVGEEHAPVESPVTQLWLAPPEAAERLDPSRLSTADRARWEKISTGRKAVEWAASRALTQHLGIAKTGNVSLSHAAAHAAIVVVPQGCSAGIDLEAIRPRDVARLAALCYSEDEMDVSPATSGLDELRDFHVRWTLKEACAKALGLPLAEALRGCRFWRHAGGWSGQLPDEVRWNGAVYEARPGLLVAAVSVGESSWHPRAWIHREWPPGQPAHWPLVAVALPAR